MSVVSAPLTTRRAAGAGLPACARIVNDHLDATPWLTRTRTRDENVLHPGGLTLTMFGPNAAAGRLHAREGFVEVPARRDDATEVGVPTLWQRWHLANRAARPASAGERAICPFVAEGGQIAHPTGTGGGRA